MCVSILNNFDSCPLFYRLLGKPATRSKVPVIRPLHRGTPEVCRGWQFQVSSFQLPTTNHGFKSASLSTELTRHMFLVLGFKSTQPLPFSAANVANLNKVVMCFCIQSVQVHLFSFGRYSFDLVLLIYYQSAEGFILLCWAVTLVGW